MGNVIRDMQSILTEILKDFHAICCEHNLTYYPLGATALGLRRHGGFCPWDDDIDRGIPRQDNEKLEALPEAAFPSHRIRYYPYTRAKGGHWPFLKVMHVGTTLVECTTSGVVLAKVGIFLDVSPLDSADSTIASGLMKWKCIRVLNILSAKNSHLQELVLRVNLCDALPYRYCAGSDTSEAPGAGGELQLTDALALMLKQGHKLRPCRFKGVRYDTGSPLGFLEANIGMALAREDMRAQVLAMLAGFTACGGLSGDACQV